jgi:hypothetical protein
MLVLLVALFVWLNRQSVTPLILKRARARIPLMRRVERRSFDLLVHSRGASTSATAAFMMRSTTTPSAAHLRLSRGPQRRRSATSRRARQRWRRK